MTEAGNASVTSMTAPDEKTTGGTMTAPDEKTTGGTMTAPDEKTTGGTMTAPDEKTTGGTMTSAQSALALFALQSGLSGTTGDSKAEDATSAGDETMGGTTSRRGSMMPSSMDSVWPGPVPEQMHQPTFLEGYTVGLFILFVTMLVLNVLTVVYMHVENEAKKAEGHADDNENLALISGMDKESVLRHPLVCVHRCSPLLGVARAHHYPKDAVCDLLYLQLPADLPVAQVRTAPCYSDFVMIASVSAVTRYGVLVDRSQSNTSYWQLKGDEGMAAFVALWGTRIKNHGLANLVFNTSTSADELQLYLPLMKRLRELQALLNELTGQQVERRYMMLDVRTSYTNPTVDLVTLSKLLRIVMTFPIDLLLLQTHLPANGTKPCMVVGPTTSVRAASMDAVDVPIMSETAVMASRAEPPDYVTVLLSFSARTLYFDVPQSWSLGMPCDKIAEPKHLGEVCVDWASIMKAGWEMAWFLRNSSRKWKVATFDYNTTVGPKMKHAYKLYTGKRLGWAVDDVEFDLDAKDYCREAFSLVGLVVQERPGRTPHLP